MVLVMWFYNATQVTFKPLKKTIKKQHCLHPRLLVDMLTCHKIGRHHWQECVTHPSFALVS